MRKLATHTRFPQGHLPQNLASSRWQRRAATLITGGLALGMFYGVVFGHNGITAYARKRGEEQSLRRQTQDLEHQNSRLQEHVDRLQNDPSAIEHQAREELHYTRSGEVIYTLQEPIGGKGPVVPND